jgi:hypothetical protein
MFLEILGITHIKGWGWIGLIGGLGAFGGKLIASASLVGPDLLPVLGAGIGVGIAIVYQARKLNRDRAMESLVDQLSDLRQQIDTAHLDLSKCREAKTAILELNEALKVQIAHLEAESGEHHRALKE